MGRFMIKGVITETPVKTVFQTGAISYRLIIRETLDCKKPVDYFHRVEYAGVFSKEIPEDIDLVGAHVVSYGNLVAISSQKGSFENCKGIGLIILSYPRFEANNEPTEVYPSDDDLPF